METVEEKKAGFKKTKVGWIPDDWEVNRVEEFSEVYAGGTPSTHKKEYWNGNIRWMSSGELNLKKVQEVKGRITQEGLANSSTRLLPIGSVLIGLAGQGKTRGTVAMNYVELCTNQSVAAILPSDKVSMNYIYFNLESRYNELRRMSAGDGGRGGLNLKIIKGLKVPLPPLPEQEKIAAILSTWDAAISETQNLIQQLQLRKKGLMQQLLTGKTRLPGFSGEWETTRIGNVANQYSAKNVAGEDITVLSCTKYDGLVPSLEYFGRQVYGDDTSKYKIVPRGYFAYATNHIEEGSIGLQTDFDKGLVSPMYTVFKTNDSINDNFFFRYLKTDRMIYKYQSNMSGSINRRGGLRWNDFKTIEISIPAYEEQKAIASVIETADQEISLQQKYLEQLQSQKKGLMQQLLTGQKRVKV